MNKLIWVGTKSCAKLSTEITKKFYCKTVCSCTTKRE